MSFKNFDRLNNLLASIFATLSHPYLVSFSCKGRRKMDGCDTTPQGRSIAVDVDSIVAAFSNLGIVSRAEVAGATPTLGGRRERRYVTLRPRQLQLAEASPPVKPREWTVGEERALVRFLLLYTESTSWSSRTGKGDNVFWEKAGAYIQKEVQSEYRRSGMLRFRGMGLGSVTQ